MKSIKKVITYQVKTLYYRESMSWLRTLYRGAGPHRQGLGNLLGFIILLCLYIIKPFKPVKLCIIPVHRISLFAGTTDLLLCRRQLENRQKRKILYVGITAKKPAKQQKPANQQLLKMFKRKFFITQSTLAYKIFRNPILGKSVFCTKPLWQSNEYYEWNNTERNLSFTESEEEQGKKLLNKMGIDDNSWFVCFHSRDPAYIMNEKWYARPDISADRGYADYRNSDVKNYLEAAKYIAALGRFAVRMGYIVAEKLPDLNNPRIIDYASYHRTDFGDIYLLAKCKFFLGSSAGLGLVPTIFHVPVAFANYIPLEVTPFRKGDLFIPKKLWSIEKKRFSTFREILESGAGLFAITAQYQQAGLEVVENTAEEILDLAKEMNERLEGKFEYTEEDEELQNRFHSLFQPHHICYGTPARIGAKFLRQNKELLK